eukprot:gene2817-1802_t
MIRFCFLVYGVGTTFGFLIVIFFIVLMIGLVVRESIAIIAASVTGSFPWFMVYRCFNFVGLFMIVLDYELVTIC